ncbi:MAG: hypothetical protein HOF22_09225 [Verrucomicrobia bacterium]|nr:hypothetical protein [Verrucomicrobiota bacterium]
MASPARVRPPPLPPPNQPLLDGDIGYHIRTGGHSVEPFDWQQFIQFADRHLKDN